MSATQMNCFYYKQQAYRPLSLEVGLRWVHHDSIFKKLRAKCFAAIALLCVLIALPEPWYFFAWQKDASIPDGDFAALVPDDCGKSMDGFGFAYNGWTPTYISDPIEILKGEYGWSADEEALARRLGLEMSAQRDNFRQQYIDKFMEKTGVEALLALGRPPRLADLYTGRPLSERDEEFDFDMDSDRSERLTVSEQVGWTLVLLLQWSAEAHATGQETLAEDYQQLFYKTWAFARDHMQRKNIDQFLYITEKGALGGANSASDWEHREWKNFDPQQSFMDGDHNRKDHLFVWQVQNITGPLGQEQIGVIHSPGVKRSNIAGNPSRFLDFLTSAPDADQDIAFALLSASFLYSDPQLADEAGRIIHDLAERFIVEVNGRPYMVAGENYLRYAQTVNHSYYRPQYYRWFAERDPEHRQQWLGLIDTAYGFSQAEGPVSWDWGSMRAVLLAPDAPGNNTGQYQIDWQLVSEPSKGPLASKAAVWEAPRVLRSVGDDFWTVAGRTRAQTYVQAGMFERNQLRQKPSDYEAFTGPYVVVYDWAHGQYPGQSTRAGLIASGLTYRGEGAEKVPGSGDLHRPHVFGTLHWLAVPWLAGDVDTTRILWDAMKRDHEQSAWLKSDYGQNLRPVDPERAKDYYQLTASLLMLETLTGSFRYVEDLWQDIDRQRASQNVPQVKTENGTLLWNNWSLPPQGVQPIDWVLPSTEELIARGYYPALEAPVQVNYYVENALKQDVLTPRKITFHVVPGDQVRTQFQLMHPMGFREADQREYEPQNRTGYWLFGHSVDPAGREQSVVYPVYVFDNANDAVKAAAGLGRMLEENALERVFYRQTFQNLHVVNGTVLGTADWNLWLGNALGEKMLMQAPWLDHQMIGMLDDLVQFAVPNGHPDVPDLMLGAMLRSPELESLTGTAARAEQLRQEITRTLVTPGAETVVSKDAMWQALLDAAQVDPVSVLAEVLDDPAQREVFKYMFREQVLNAKDARSAIAMQYLLAVHALGVPNDEAIHGAAQRKIDFVAFETAPGIPVHQAVKHLHAMAMELAFDGDFAAAVHAMDEADRRMHGDAFQGIDSKVRDRDPLYYASLEIRADILVLQALSGQSMHANPDDLHTPMVALEQAKQLFETLLADYAQGGLRAENMGYRAQIHKKLGDALLLDAMYRQNFGAFRAIDGHFDEAIRLNQDPHWFDGEDRFITMEARLGKAELRMQHYYSQYAVSVDKHNAKDGGTQLPVEERDALRVLLSQAEDTYAEAIQSVRAAEDHYREPSFRALPLKPQALDEASFVGDQDKAELDALAVYYAQAFSGAGKVKISRYYLDMRYGAGQAQVATLSLDLLGAQADFSRAGAYATRIAKGTALFSDWKARRYWTDTMMACAEGQLAYTHALALRQVTTLGRKLDHQSWPYQDDQDKTPELQAWWKEYFASKQRAYDLLQQLERNRDLVPLSIQRTQRHFLMARADHYEAVLVHPAERAHTWTLYTDAVTHAVAGLNEFYPYDGVSGRVRPIAMPLFVQRDATQLGEELYELDELFGGGE